MRMGTIAIEVQKIVHTGASFGSPIFLPKYFLIKPVDTHANLS